MPVFYKAAQSILENKAGKKLFYPRIVLKGNVTTDQIAREIAEYSSLSKGDTKNTIDNLVRVMTTHLQSSESVTLDGFGTFRMTMKSNGKGVEAADKVSAAQATLTVRFLPSYTKNPDRTVATRSMVTGVKCLPYNSKVTETVPVVAAAVVATAESRIIRWTKRQCTSATHLRPTTRAQY